MRKLCIYTDTSERSLTCTHGGTEARKFQLGPIRVLPKSACLNVAGRMRHAQVKVVIVVSLDGCRVANVSVSIWVWICNILAFGL